MAKNKNLQFLKSNYTLRKQHKTLKDGTIVYERDYMVTTNGGGWDSGSIPHGESNFKFVNRDDKKDLRKHKYGKALKTEEGSDFWTMDDVQKYIGAKKSITSDESKMNLKPVYNSLLDFAYFGSCVEMIKASINDIITKYPGEMYVTDSGVTYFDNETQNLETIGWREGFDDLYLISNPYNIDVHTQYLTKFKKNQPGYRALQYFCEARNQYKILNKNENLYCGLNRWILNIANEKFACLQNGDYVGRVLIAGEYDPTIPIEGNFSGESQFIIYVYYANDQIIYLTDKKWEGFHIRPINSSINEFYDTLDDFEKFLLNGNTTPRYTMTIDTLEETEKGISFGKKSFTWPTLYGWNLDIETSNYKKYIDELLKLSEFYDNYYSNNLWRMMVHDSIKNMDLTFSNPSKDEDVTDYNIGTTKVQGLFWAIGRLFDDLKRYIDNIGSVNQITYSQRNNISDYLLTDKLELNGWETYDPTKTLDPETVVDKVPLVVVSGTVIEYENLYTGISKKYTLEDVKSLFYSTLAINSKDIFVRKGTRQAIEMVLGLFGLTSYEYGKTLYMSLPESLKIKDENKNPIQWDNLSEANKAQYYDYELNEYVAVVSNTKEDIVNIDEELPMEYYNSLKTSYVEANEFGEPHNPLQGLPVREITIEVASTDSEETEYKKYLIPWFSKKDKHDGNTYFQMYGGWSDLSLKKISEEIAPNVTEIRSDNNFKIYAETQKYLKYKSNVKDLLNNKYSALKNGDIYFVNDVSDATGLTDPSNYFILVNKENFRELGKDAWKNVPKTDIEQGIFDGIKVLYLESLIDDSNGNNPHVGYGNYDNGKAYLEYFRQIFKYNIETDSYDNPTFVDEAYDCATGKLLSGITECGFTVSDFIRDNMKIWYFTPDNEEPLPILTGKEVVGEDPETGEEYTFTEGYEFAGFNYNLYVGEDAVKNKQTKLSSDLHAFNLETQEDNSNSESASDSVINVKNLEIKIVDKYSDIEAFKEYLYNVIVPYLLQVIPSTTISRIYIGGVYYEMSGCKEYAEITGSVDKNDSDKAYFSHEREEETNVITEFHAQDNEYEYGPMW